MKNKEFDKMLEAYFYSKSTLEPDPEVLKNIKSEINNYEIKKQMPKPNLWKIILSWSCVVLVAILSIILPLVLKNDVDQTTQYYTENDVEQINLDSEFVNNFINENFYNYIFILEECNIIEARGIYLKDTNNLLALSLELFNEFTFTELDLNLVINNNYTYNKDSFYKKDAEITTVNNVKIYKKVSGEIYSKVYNVLLQFENYNIYIEMNNDDQDFINKFIKN